MASHIIQLLVEQGQSPISRDIEIDKIYVDRVSVSNALPAAWFDGHYYLHNMILVGSTSVLLFIAFHLSQWRPSLSSLDLMFTNHRGSLLSLGLYLMQPCNKSWYLSHRCNFSIMRDCYCPQYLPWWCFRHKEVARRDICQLFKILKKLLVVNLFLLRTNNFDMLSLFSISTCLKQDTTGPVRNRYFLSLLTKLQSERFISVVTFGTTIIANSLWHSTPDTDKSPAAEYQALITDIAHNEIKQCYTLQNWRHPPSFPGDSQETSRGPPLMYQFLVYCLIFQWEKACSIFAHSP